MTETDLKVLAYLSTGPKKASQVGVNCFAPSGPISQRHENRLTVVAGSQLRRLEKMGRVVRITTGLAPNERTTWQVAAPNEKDLFDP